MVVVEVQFAEYNYIQPGPRHFQIIKMTHYLHSTLRECSEAVLPDQPIYKKAQ